MNCDIQAVISFDRNVNVVIQSVMRTYLYMCSRM